MTLSELDTFYIKAVAALHSKEHLRTGDVTPLQKYVEEAIKAKSGKEKDLTAIVATCMVKQAIEDFRNINVEETKTASSSDNELELDLLKEDLMCVICNGMDVAARNRLLECSDCHSLYHQECHRPPVSQQEADNAWICLKCKDSKKMRKSPSLSRSVSPHGGKSVSKSLPSTSSSSSSSAHRTSSSSSNSNNNNNMTSSSYKSSSSSSKPAAQKPSSSSGKPSAKQQPSSSSNSSSSSSSRSMVTPNINIISADKRIQSMKKKAAKLQEKRKLPR